MVLTLARDARHAFCVLWSVVVFQRDVAAISNNEELWGEMYIGMKVMIMGKWSFMILSFEGLYWPWFLRFWHFVPLMAKVKQSKGTVCVMVHPHIQSREKRKIRLTHFQPSEVSRFGHDGFVICIPPLSFRFSSHKRFLFPPLSSFCPKELSGPWHIIAVFLIPLIRYASLFMAVRSSWTADRMKYHTITNQNFCNSRLAFLSGTAPKV